MGTGNCAHLVARCPACHGGDMATYTISPRSNQAGFDVAVIGDDGARQTMLGFQTKAEAEAWIDEDKRREAPAVEAC